MEETTTVMRWVAAVLAVVLITLVAAFIASTRLRHRRRRSERDHRTDAAPDEPRTAGAFTRSVQQVEARVARSLSKLDSRRTG